MRGAARNWARPMLTALIPKVFYSDLSIALDLFADGVGMQVLHRDDTLVVLGKDRAKVYLVQDAEYAAKDRLEIAIETDDIDAVYVDVARGALTCCIQTSAAWSAVSGARASSRFWTRPRSASSSATGQHRTRSGPNLVVATV